MKPCHGKPALILATLLAALCGVQAEAVVPETGAVPGTGALPATRDIPVAGPIRKVLIIGIDGLRPDALRKAHAPHMDDLIKGGAFAANTLTDVLSRSGPGWTSVFTGVWNSRHGVRNNAFEGYRRTEYPTFFSRLKECRPEIAVGAVVNWSPIGTHLVGTDGFWMAPGGDREVGSEAARIIRRSDSDVLFVHFDDVDHAGHTFGFSPHMPFYIWAVERVDRYVGGLRAAVREREAAGEEWLILSTSDHGGSYRHHGENIPSHRRVFLIANGKGVSKGVDESVRGVVDLPPTVFAWLGIPVPPAWAWEGRPLGLASVPPRAAEELAQGRIEKQRP